MWLLPVAARGSRADYLRHPRRFFYDSRGNAIYVGKIEKLDFWTEANNALARDRKELQCVRLVDHPRTNVAFKPAFHT
jgi:hypothetical protein